MAQGFKGRRSYELTVYQPLTKDYGNVTSKALIGEDAQYNSLYEEAFVPVEEVYNAFVRANEMDVPEEYRDVIQQIGGAVVGKPQKQSEAVFRIRSYFAKNFTYSVDTPAPDAGKDPLLQFLTETRTGYCAHFASAAVLLLREAGFPARYAEGYYVSQELVDSVEKETDVTLEVPDSASHAWVELYKDGVGWVPVEVTPGFFETKDSEQSTATTPQTQTLQPEETPPEDSEDDTSEDGGGQDEPEPEQEDSQQARSFSWLILLLPLALLFLLIPMVYDRLLRKRIERADSPEATAQAFRYLMMVFRRQSLKPDPARPRTVARLLGDEKEAYLHTIDLFNKETFSAEGLTRAEREQACDTVLRLTSDIKLLRAARKQLREETNPKTEAHHGK